MIALVILLVLALYAAAAYATTRAVYRRASRRRALWAWLTALAFFLVPLWDFLPTLVAFQYYCRSEAGVTIYKPVAEWVAEKGSPRTLTAEPSPAPQGFLRDPLVDQVVLEVNSPPEPTFLSVKRTEWRVVDLRTGAVLMRNVDFSSGYTPLGTGGAGAWKFWLHAQTCPSRSEGGSREQFNKYIEAIRAAGAAKKG